MAKKRGTSLMNVPFLKLNVKVVPWFLQSLICLHKRFVQKWPYNESLQKSSVRNMCKIFSIVPSKKNCHQRKLRRTDCLLFNFWSMNFTVSLPKKSIWYLVIWQNWCFYHSKIEIQTFKQTFKWAQTQNFKPKVSRF